LALTLTAAHLHSMEQMFSLFQEQEEPLILDVITNNSPLIFSVNLIDGSRRSLNYEVRLYKYAIRGFAVGIPGYDSAFLDSPRLDGKHPRNCVGLTKLLVYDRDFRRKSLEQPARVLHKRLQFEESQEIAPSKKMHVSVYSSDYCWLPPWGQLTDKGIKELYFQVSKL
jgi:hypothetical protein